MSAVSTHPTWCCGGVVNLCLAKCFSKYFSSLTRVKHTARIKCLSKGHVSVWISSLSSSSVCLGVNKMVFCGGIGRCDLYLSDIELCKQQRWCIVMFGGLYSLSLMWSEPLSLICCNYHSSSLSKESICAFGVDWKCAHTLYEWIPCHISWEKKSFIHHAMETYRMKPILRRPIIFPLGHYFYDNIPQCIYFLHSFIHFCFLNCKVFIKCGVIVQQTTIENNNIHFGGKIYLIMFWIKLKQTLIKRKLIKTIHFCKVALFHFQLPLKYICLK